MSYCVNCGVELDSSAKKCALCDTVIINPNTQQKEDKTPFSQQEHTPTKVKTQFIAYIVSMVFLIPNIVCILSNILIWKQNYWSIAVVTTSFLVWIIFVLPFFTSKRKTYLILAFDTLSVMAYTYVPFYFFHLDMHLYFKCLMPYFISVSASMLIYLIWAKTKYRHWLLRLICIFAFTAISMLSGGMVADFNGYKTYPLNIGIIVSASCLAIIGFLIYCYSSKKMRKWLSQRFFI